MPSRGRPRLSKSPARKSALLDSNPCGPSHTSRPALQGDAELSTDDQNWRAKKATAWSFERASGERRTGHLRAGPSGDGMAKREHKARAWQRTGMGMARRGSTCEACACRKAREMRNKSGRCLLAANCFAVGANCQQRSGSQAETRQAQIKPSVSRPGVAAASVKGDWRAANMTRCCLRIVAQHSRERILATRKQKKKPARHLPSTVQRKCARSKGGDDAEARITGLID